MKICEDPDILNFVYIVKIVLELLLIVAVVSLIVMIMIDVIKAISSSDFDTKKIKNNIIKRIMAMAIVFLVPVILNFVLNLVPESLEYGSCLDNANADYISLANSNKAEYLLAEAEKSLTPNLVSKAQKYINRVVDDKIQATLEERLEIVKEEIKNKEELEKARKKAEKEAEESNKVDSSYDGYSTTGACSSDAAVVALTKEPDPSCAINYWPNIINAKNFIFPTRNNKYLGSWPKNHESIPTMLTNMKTYADGKLIWPVTPVNGVYKFGYQHNGIDIAAVFGTPIYSPVSGTLVYSTWGHTGNTGSDETAYSVSIVMDETITYEDKEYSQIFLTHLSGIVNRCTNVSTCNKKVKKGELIGYIGNAAGSAQKKGWAPHLHMSIYPYGNYKAGLKTSDIEILYSITSGDSIKAGG